MAISAQEMVVHAALRGILKTRLRILGALNIFKPKKRMDHEEDLRDGSVQDDLEKHLRDWSGRQL